MIGHFKYSEHLLLKYFRLDMEQPSRWKTDIIHVLSMYEILTITDNLRGVDILTLCRISREYRSYFSQVMFWDRAIAKEYKSHAKRWINKEEKHSLETLALSRRALWPAGNNSVLEDKRGEKKAIGDVCNPSWICVNLKDIHEWIPCPDFTMNEGDMLKWKYLDLNTNITDSLCKHQSNLKTILNNARAKIWHLEQNSLRLHEGRNFRPIANGSYRCKVPINAGATEGILKGLEVFIQTWIDKTRQIEKEIFLAFSISQKYCPRWKWDRRLVKKYQKLLTRIEDLEQSNAELMAKLRKAAYNLTMSGHQRTPMSYI